MRVNCVLYNGVLCTLDARLPRASAIALAGDRIVTLGDDDEIRDLLAPGGTEVNLGGRLVIPGLTDGHAHLSLYADFLQTVSLHDMRSVQEAVRRVAERAAETPPGQWVRGWGWWQDDWPDRAFPTASQLDAAVPDHPVYLTARSGHAAWVNSAGLRQANISSSTPDPHRGRIQRDPRGQPTGILFEEALHLVQEVIPGPTPEELADRILQTISVCHRLGLTGVHDFDQMDCFQALQMLRTRGALTLRVVKSLPVELLDEAVALGLRSGFGDDYLGLGAIKMFADGALGSHTAAMLAPFEGEPDNLGIVVTSRDEIADKVCRASAAGIPSAVHAIGDRAVRDVLDAMGVAREREQDPGAS